MDEKLAFYRPTAVPRASFPPPPRRRRLLPLALITALFLYYYLAGRPWLDDLARTKLFSGSFSRASHRSKHFSSQEQAVLAHIPLATPIPQSATELQEAPRPGDVDLEAHIMSQCPDAQDCIQQMIIPAMEEIAPLVNFTLSFIGTVSEDGDSVECKHGPAECLGNMLMLCADALYPDIPIISLGFANCLISDYARLSDRDFVEGCALQHAVDFDRLNDCATDDALGPAMLRRSVRWSKDQGVVYSCTVRVNGQKWCVRDDGEWKECEGGSAPGDLIQRIKTLAQAE